MKTTEDLINRLKELREDAIQGHGMTKLEVIILATDGIHILENLPGPATAG